MFFLVLELDIYLITKYSLFKIMVTNTIIIATMLVLSLGITSSPLVFGDIQQDSPISQQVSLEGKSLDLMKTLFSNNNIDTERDNYNSQYDERDNYNSQYDERDNYNSQYVTTQSHGLIKNKDIGVLVYTHGNPMVPHTSDTMKTELIEKNLEKMGHPAEIVTHMPYNWDQGLMNLDQENVKYAVFLYTDLFGPMSTVIHNVTRGIFGEIERYQFCPGVPMPNDSCLYMGMLTEPASKVSNTTLVFAEPARPDHPIIRNAFVEQAAQISEIPRKEILVLVGHGARSDTNDMYQVRELQNVADYVQYKMGFREAIAVTAREDWPELQEPRIMEIVEQVKEALMKTHAEKVILAPATGAGMGFQMVKEALEAEGIDVDEGAELNSFAQKEFKKWSSLVMKETAEFIKKKAPQENTITPQWNRNYR
jgi:hypothetical protein